MGAIKNAERSFVLFWWGGFCLGVVGGVGCVGNMVSNSPGEAKTLGTGGERDVKERRTLLNAGRRGTWFRRKGGLKKKERSNHKNYQRDTKIDLK